jgi:hypothetical protein
MTLSLEERANNFILKANLFHNYKYDYSKVNYVRSDVKVEIICPKHGSFMQMPESHINKIHSGCYQCGREVTNNCVRKRIISMNDFLTQANQKHHNFYDYSKVTYNNGNSKIIIICPKHGEFSQKLSKHLIGQGCKICSKDRLHDYFSRSYQTFINQANEIHHYRYDYSLSQYYNDRTKVKIVCHKHGEFEQIPNAHLRGQGCPTCGSGYSISNKEKEWLDSLLIPKEYRQIILKIDDKIFKVDGFDPATNTIYEFYGNFWHGNPLKFDHEKVNLINKIKFKDLFNKTIERESFLIQKGYHIIFKWETEFDHNDFIKNKEINELF